MKYYRLPADGYILSRVQTAIRRTSYCGYFEDKLLSMYNRFITTGKISFDEFNRAMEHKLCPHENLLSNQNVTPGVTK